METRTITVENKPNHSPKDHWNSRTIIFFFSIIAFFLLLFDSFYVHSRTFKGSSADGHINARLHCSSNVKKIKIKISLKRLVIRYVDNVVLTRSLKRRVGDSHRTTHFFLHNWLSNYLFPFFRLAALGVLMG